MDDRRFGRVAEWGLTAAVIALHAIIFLWPENWSRPNFLLITAHDAQLLSATVIIIGWVVLGPGRLWVRLAAAPALAWLWFLLLNRALDSREITAAFFAAYVGCVAVLVSAVRALGLQVRRFDGQRGRERGAQFSLSVLIVATTLIALAIGGLEALRPMVSLAGPWERYDMDDLLSFGRSTRVGEQVRELMAAGFLSLAALSGVWTALRPGAPWVRLAANVVLMGAAGLYLAHLSAAAGINRGLADATLLMPTAASLAVAFLVTAGMAALWVLPLRFMDYRLLRTAPAPCQTPVTVDERIQLAKQGAVVLLVLVVIGFLCAGRKLTQDRGGSSGRINWNTSAIASRPLFDTHDVVAPLNALGQWAEQGAAIGWDLELEQRLSISSGGGGLDVMPVTEGGGILSIVVDPAETPLVAPTDEQLEEISRRLQK
jgi:hypothetical protein